MSPEADELQLRLAHLDPRGQYSSYYGVTTYQGTASGHVQ